MTSSHSFAFYLRAACFSGSHMILSALGGGAAAVFIAMAFSLAVVSNFGLSPASVRWLATPGSTVEMRVFIVKTLLVLSSIFLVDVSKLQALVLFVGPAYMAWCFARCVCLLLSTRHMLYKNIYPLQLVPFYVELLASASSCK